MNKNTNKVVTITLNPALDLTGHLNSINIGSISLVNEGKLHAGGKGINVAKVLADLGAEVTVTGFLGRDNETDFCQLFDDMSAKDKFVRVDGSTRINVKLVEKNGNVSDINFPGINITKQAIIQFEKGLFELAEAHDFFVLAGSLPEGISPELCASWIDKLKKLGKNVIFDSSGSSLAVGVEVLPWLIKPNEHELSELVGHNLISDKDYQQAGGELFNKGIENVVISLGEKGVMWLCKGKENLPLWLYAQPPKVNVVSTVGAGDSLVAGFCWGAMNKWQPEQVLSFSIALSALAVTQVCVGVTNLDTVTDLQNKIVIE